ncbi:hypothetical protein TSAR_006680 [Trichomalopsis sarcophagae]|uniref:Uncharacterized protein n=1 Tax=Trichomalopsis sarcophagae TaxID=543379 RepID=A0A232F3Q9_9HYME|nr:hypothetical protein TSAR_006680 [Trichomalopsis sarcophagae]
MAYQNDSRSPLGTNLKDYCVRKTFKILERNELSSRMTPKFASSLRIPDDTSWPKIPERRLHENVISNSKGPCIVSFTRENARKNKVERCDNNETSNISSSLQAISAAEPNAPTCTDSITSNFKRTMTATTDSFDKSKNNQSKSNDSIEKEATEKSDQPGDIDKDAVQKSGRSDTAKNLEIFNNQAPPANKTNDTEIIKSTALEQHHFSEEAKKPNVSTDNEAGLIGRNDERSADTAKEEDARNRLGGSTAHTNVVQHQRHLRKNATSERLLHERTAGSKLRSSRGELHVSDTSDYSEADSSDARKAGQMQGFTDSGYYCAEIGSELAFKDYASRKCSCFDSCYCSVIRRPQRSSRVSRRCAHHSEPQIGNSRRCSTAYGARTPTASRRSSAVAYSRDLLPRVASDSDCAADGNKRANDFNSQPEIGMADRIRMIPPFDAANYEMSIMGAPESKKRKSEAQQLSVFFQSSKFNPSDECTAAAAKGAGSARRTDDTIENSTSSSLGLLHSALERNPQGDKQADRRLLNFKTAAFFGCFVFGTLLALPLVYDYLFYEEEIEEYEELGYIELLLDYVVSSFREAFAGLLDLISKIVLAESVTTLIDAPDRLFESFNNSSPSKSQAPITTIGLYLVYRKLL